MFAEEGFEIAIKWEAMTVIDGLVTLAKVENSNCPDHMPSRMVQSAVIQVLIQAILEEIAGCS